jgi:LacI family transcriptional regulator
MTVSRLDKILFAQGITGIIVLPYGAATGRNLALSWERYAVASISYSWNLLPCDRVSTDHQENVHLACAELLRRGYSRIGICLPPETAAWENRFWPPACLFWQQSLPASQRLPLFTGKPGETPLSDFQAWLKDSRPEVLVTLTAHEKEWLDELGLRIPHDLDLICLNRPFNSIYTGIEENHDTVGATALELVADQVTHNRLGTPARLRRILIAGTWVEGETLKRPPLESVIDLTTQEQRA